MNDNTRSRGSQPRKLIFLCLVITLLVACQQNNPSDVTTGVVDGGMTPAGSTTTIQPTFTLPAPPVVTTPVPSAEAGPDNPTVAPSPVADGRYFNSPEYGIQAFLWWKPDIAQRDLGLINDMGFGWVKQTFAWRDIETLEKGSYDWWHPDTVVDAVEAAGLKMVVRLDRQPFWSQEPGTPPMENTPPANLQDFADFCFAVAERYRGRIEAYQVWNEPNLSREWGDKMPDPAGYTELLRICYTAIKSADPNAIVISAGLAPTGTQPPAAMPDADFLQSMYSAGAGEYFDVLGLNAPGFKAPPEAAPEEGEDPASGYGGGRWFVFRHVEDMRAIMVANGDETKQVAILEMGWTTDQVNPSYSWFAVDEQTQADYLVRAYQYARENWSPWMGLMTTIYIADYHWTAEANEQWWWSIVLPDGTPRPGYFALQNMPKN